METLLTIFALSYYPIKGSKMGSRWEAFYWQYW